MCNFFRLIQDGTPVAWAEGPGALAEIKHYAMVYRQHGPVVIQQRRQGRWRPFVEGIPA